MHSTNADEAERFLLQIGFTEMSAEYLRILASMICDSAAGHNFSIRESYHALSGAHSEDALRTGLTYHIKKNYDRVRDTLHREYHCDIGPYFCGNKNFVRKIATIYYVYG